MSNLRFFRFALWGTKRPQGYAQSVTSVNFVVILLGESVYHGVRWIIRSFMYGVAAGRGRRAFCTCIGQYIANINISVAAKAATTRSKVLGFNMIYPSLARWNIVKPF